MEIANVIDYLELVGNASGKEILEFFGSGFDPEQLFKAVEDQEVMMSKNSSGQKWYTYPFPDERERSDREMARNMGWKEVRRKNWTIGILAYLELHDGANGREIKDHMGMTQVTADPLLAKLVDDGKLTRVRDGRAWRYSLAKKPVGNRPTVEDEDLASLSPFEEKVVKNMRATNLSTASKIGEKLLGEGITFTKKQLAQALSALVTRGYARRIIEDGKETRYSSMP